MKNEIKKISEEEVEEIALLTRIAMNKSEISLMAGQMSNILAGQVPKIYEKAAKSYISGFPV